MLNLKSYLTLHLQSAFNSLGEITRSPITSLMTCLVIGITLAFPTALFVLLKNMEYVKNNFQQSSQLTLYLKKNTSETHVEKLVSAIKTKATVSDVYTISPEKALAELQDSAGFNSVLNQLNENPLPWTIVVIPKIKSEDLNSINLLNEDLKGLSQVETVQSDMLWVKRFSSLVSLTKSFIFTLTIFLGAAVLLIVNNTIRSATQNSQKEIDVIKLIGGTNAFIRRPFLYAGMIYGLLGAIIAWEVVEILLMVLDKPVHNFANLYHSQFELSGLGFLQSMKLLFFSIILGFIGSWLAVRRHLKHN